MRPPIQSSSLWKDDYYGNKHKITAKATLSRSLLNKKEVKTCRWAATVYKGFTSEHADMYDAGQRQGRKGSW